MNKNAEQGLLNNPEVRSRLEQALEIAQKYYPASSLSWGIWNPNDKFEGFEIGRIEIEELNTIAGLVIEFDQDWAEEGFPLNPYKIVKVAFSANSTDENPYLDIAYSCIGNKEYDNWLTDDRPPNQNIVVAMCDEIFLALSELTISAEFK